ncbi:Fe-S cluster assembly protein NifU [Candidatus Atelocyanobacterium thalassae]|jgi:NifU-like protein|uniref:Nitrogen fixation protein NifU n=1 Tax=Atelocyanobacterium thalassa (isolate ALOHA) TaxID=1453429 RepID=B7TB37_ATETH|nr:Fe-S cluster assembly protein NifU [Candidatus Atelocyanobacterium thalassa]ACJ53725.1 Fe-S cluster assembly protein NifU [Candidatus Atelocyanobacterium thalassa isolate ALOHA]|tara:strand:+ start:49953 stop:50837 length:885 start_codon:yes stop_codon:yes gene_type:complete
MWEYTDKVMDFFHNPRNQGVIDEKESGQAITTGEVGSIACGDALKLHLKIDEKSQTILEARFQTFGCASAIASSSALTELLVGKTLDEALSLTNKEIADYLGGLPEEKMHCSVMGQEALEAAIFNYRGIPLDNHEDDEGALICRCFGVTSTRIRRIVLENSLTTAEQVTNYVKAGGGCGSCLTDIDDIIVDVAEEGFTLTEDLSSEANIPELEVKTLTNLQKITLIQQVLEEEVKPALAKDGGDVELFDIEGNLIKVVLKGACSSCSSSTFTLKTAIEARLRERISKDLTVIAV